MTEYRLEIRTKDPAVEGQATITGFSIGGVVQEFTRRVVRDQVPEFAECELWEKPREKWRKLDGWIYRKERWT